MLQYAMSKIRKVTATFQEQVANVLLEQMTGVLQ